MICEDEMTLVAGYAVVINMGFVLFTCSCSLLRTCVESSEYSYLDFTNNVFFLYFA